MVSAGWIKTVEISDVPSFGDVGVWHHANDVPFLVTAVKPGRQYGVVTVETQTPINGQTQWELRYFLPWQIKAFNHVKH